MYERHYERIDEVERGSIDLETLVADIDALYDMEHFDPFAIYRKGDHMSKKPEVKKPAPQPVKKPAPKKK